MPFRTPKGPYEHDHPPWWRSGRSGSLSAKGDSVQVVAKSPQVRPRFVLISTKKQETCARVSRIGVVYKIWLQDRRCAGFGLDNACYQNPLTYSQSKSVQALGYADDSKLNACTRNFKNVCILQTVAHIDRVKPLSQCQIPQDGCDGAEQPPFF